MEQNKSLSQTSPENLSNKLENQLTGHYGATLMEKLRNSNANYDEMDSFNKFVWNNGWKYKTEKELDEAYSRLQKHKKNLLLTEKEFILEAGDHYDAQVLKAVYASLKKLVKEGKMAAGEIYRYAACKWCLSSPQAIIAYISAQLNQWFVNNCDIAISVEEAIVQVNREWGFEASRIKIIGIPYYDVTDYQFIRFDCGNTAWLWMDGQLYDVC